MTTTPTLMKASLAVRGGLGAAAYLAPRTTARAMGIDPRANPAAPYLGRVFGIRDVVLAALGATAADADRRRLIVGFAAIDTFDLLSAALGRRAGYLDTRATAALVTAAVLALVPEVLELRDEITR